MWSCHLHPRRSYGTMANQINGDLCVKITRPLLLGMAAAIFAIIITAAIGLTRHHRPFVTAVAPIQSAVSPVKAPRMLRPPLPNAQLAALHADEAGHIPILMYHAIDGPAFHGARYDHNGLNIAAATFRKHLDLMYAAHWYPVNMRDVLTSRIDVPAGKTPVVLTFDDARGTQFHYLPDGTIAPNCAVGILEAFHQKHPDWPLRATFYVLPKSSWNPVPFWQPGLETKKLRFLVAEGFEVANHTTTHRPMTHLSASDLCWEMAECQRYVRDRAPGATMDTMAVPGGSMPKNHALWPLLLRGQLGKIIYHNRCILMAWGGPSHSYVDKEYDPNRISRIGTGPGWVERAIKQMTARRIRPYVSDGNPDTVAVPRADIGEVDTHRLQGARLVVYADGSSPKPKPGVKPAVPNKQVARQVARGGV